VIFGCGGRSFVTKHEQESLKIFIIYPFCEHTRQRDFFALDCPASAQSRAKPFGRLGGVGSDHSQPHNRLRFASRSFAKPHCLACRMGSRQSAGEFLNQLIPRNLRKRRLLRHSDLYRGFESHSLRHAVLTAENPCLYFPQNARTMPIFRDNSSANRTAENGLLTSERGH
jgi:hypothetical protein